MISKRLSDIFRDKEYSDKDAPIYIEVLKNSSFNETLNIPLLKHAQTVAVKNQNAH